MKKKAIRKLYREQRNALSQEDFARFSLGIEQQFLQLPLPQVNVLMSYRAMPRFAEFDPVMIEKQMSERVDKPVVCYPRLNDGMMEAVTPQHDAVWMTNSFGTSEVKHGTIMDPAKIDLVIVPLLAFDKRGYRVGYGKGYYDGFLKQCRADAVTVGVSFFDPLDRIEDTDAWDIPLKYVLTPGFIYSF